MTGPQLNQTLSTLLFGTALTLAVVTTGSGAAPVGALRPIAWDKVRRDAYALLVAMGESMMKSEQMCGPMSDCLWLPPTWAADDMPAAALTSAPSSARRP